MKTFDLVVVGAGPGGYVAAIRASQNGMKVAIVEREKLGGICLNWGCIPTKSLLKSAEVFATIKNASLYGIDVGQCKFDISKIVEKSRSTAQNLSNGIDHLMKKNKITVVKGTAALGSSQTLAVLNESKEQLIESNAIILATGARPRTLPNLPSHERIWYAREAMTPPFMPKTLAIIGSGAIGMEFASFYATLGVTVTVIEIQSQILVQEDQEISAMAHKIFSSKGISFRLDTKAENIRATAETVELDLISSKDSSKLLVDAVIIAIGVTGNIEDIGLENTLVQTNNGSIIINQYCATDDPHIYAIGDVAGQPWLAHKASHEAIICVDHIAGKPVHAIRRDSIPACTYTSPQIASVGLTEKRAREMYDDICIGTFPYIANGKAQVIGETQGMIKSIFNKKTGELIGAHIIGSQATEMINGFVIAKNLEATEQDLVNTIFPHPTLSESIHESVLNALGQSLHY